LWKLGGIPPPKKNKQTKKNKVMKVKGDYSGGRRKRKMGSGDKDKKK
jgi:hypothetical protein